MTEVIPDNGEWELFLQADGKVGIISSDFTHDVVLYVNGDFGDDEERKAYARGIAERLNRTRP